MAIDRIDYEKCTGCGICVNSCWMDVIRMDETTKKAVIQYPGDCAVCCTCEVDCPVHAIHISPKMRSYSLTCW
jgi:NAD-dependent dihydropyrimidine dehydrogenase PreA subunit